MSRRRARLRRDGRGVYATSARTRGSTYLRPSYLKTRFQVQIQDQASLRDPQCQPQTSPPSTPLLPHLTPPSPPASRATDTSYASRQTTSPTVNPAAPAPSGSALAARRHPRKSWTLRFRSRPRRPHPDDGGCSPPSRSMVDRTAAAMRVPFLSNSRWSSGMHGHTNAEAEAAAMRVPPPQVLVLITTIPWQESSLYRPPGWVQVLTALRDGPSRSTGRSGGRGRGNRDGDGNGRAS